MCVPPPSVVVFPFRSSVVDFLSEKRSLLPLFHRADAASTADDDDDDADVFLLLLRASVLTEKTTTNELHVVAVLHPSIVHPHTRAREEGGRMNEPPKRAGAVCDLERERGILPLLDTLDVSVRRSEIVRRKEN